MDDKTERWIKNLEKSRDAQADLSRDEDLSIALMNLISLEEHFFFSAVKTENGQYLEMLQSVRTLRQKLMQTIVKDPKGEEWCISKHLLAASMRLYEVGTKEFSQDKKKEAELYFRNAFDLYSLFFAINLGMVKPGKLVKNDNFRKEEENMGRFSQIIKKIVDCCKEW